MDWIARLDAVRDRLHALAARELRGLTPADPSTGERWESGQVWAHLAEFGDYWLDELDCVLHATKWPVPFGRVKTDAGRIAAIERDRSVAVPELVARIDRSMARLEDQLRRMTNYDWEKTGLHSTLGVMSIDDQLQHFHIGHYEEHADQLDSLSTP